MHRMGRAVRSGKIEACLSSCVHVPRYAPVAGPASLPAPRRMVRGSIPRDLDWSWLRTMWGVWISRSSAASATPRRVSTLALRVRCSKQRAAGCPFETAIAWPAAPALPSALLTPSKWIRPAAALWRVMGVEDTPLASASASPVHWRSSRDGTALDDRTGVHGRHVGDDS